MWRKWTGGSERLVQISISTGSDAEPEDFKFTPLYRCHSMNLSKNLEDNLSLDKPTCIEIREGKIGKCRR